MKLGICTFAYAWAIGVPGYPPSQPLDSLGFLDKAIELGLSVVQFGDNLPLHALSESELTALAARAATHNIQIEIGARGLASEHLRTYLALATRLGSPILRVVVDTAEHHPSVEEVIALTELVLPEFERAGVVLAIENHDRFHTDDLLTILETLQSAHVGICLDTVNSFGSLQGPQVVVDALAPWTVNLHVKDFAIRRADHNMGFMLEGRPAGQGQLDIPWLLGSLAAHGRDVNAILELWPAPEPTLDATIAKEDAWARASVTYLRGLIAG